MTVHSHRGREQDQTHFTFATLGKREPRPFKISVFSWVHQILLVALGNSKTAEFPEWIMSLILGSGIAKMNEDHFAHDAFSYST